MRKITVIYDGSAYTYRWLKPLFWAKDEFKKLGFEIEHISLFGYLAINSKDFANYFLKVACKQKFDIVYLAFHPTVSIDKLPMNTCVRGG